MRVITGSARGAKLLAADKDGVRPTAQRVKEAEFSAVQFYVPGAAVLDLFAGSGQLGLEALSRGAKSAVFVEAADECVRIIRENVKKTGLGDRARVLKSDAFRYLSGCSDTFDIVFIDPPYELSFAKKALRRAARLLSESGIIICETRKDEKMPSESEGLGLAKRYDYSQTSVWLYRKSEEPEGE